MKLPEIRKIIKNNDGYYGKHKKLTVIKRDGNIVIREDISSPRNHDLILEMLNSFVRRTFKVNTIPNLFKGRKGIYTNYWAEAIIDQ